MAVPSAKNGGTPAIVIAGTVRASDDELHRAARKGLHEGSYIVFNIMPATISRIIEHQVWKTRTRKFASFGQYALDRSSDGLGIENNQLLWLLRCALDVDGRHVAEWASVLEEVERAVKVTAKAEGKKIRSFDGNSLESLGKACAGQHADKITYLPSRNTNLDGDLIRLRKSAPDSYAKVLSGEINVRDAVASAGKPKNARSVMADREGEDDGLYPTPPYATRALVERVLPALGLTAAHLGTVLDPACGEGHISGVLEEYVTGGSIIASDVEPCQGRDPPGWTGARDFLVTSGRNEVDWTITNPPFGNKALPFALRALEVARVGVALFLPLRWLETIGRYENLFRDRPPTLVAPFVERVNLCKGRWDPDGSTATAYMWLVWVNGWSPRPMFWIPPGCRKELARPDDVERFTSRPVKALYPPLAGAGAKENFRTVPKPYAPGASVMHARFGRGLVADVEDVQLLTIDFDDTGRKRVIGRFVSPDCRA